MPKVKEKEETNTQGERRGCGEEML